MKKEIINELIFELAGLTPDTIDEKYNRVFTRWKFDNSDEVWIDGRLIDKGEKWLIQVSMYDIRPVPKKIIVSELKGGFELTEQMFVKKMIRKLKQFADADYPDDTWQMRIDLFLDYLQNKTIRTTSDPTSDPTKTKHPYPLLSPKFDAEKVYNQFFKGEVCLCTLDCFNDWFVNGYQSEKITATLQGRISSKTDNRALSKAQIRKFMEVITDNSTKLKEGYYNNVFGLKLNKTNSADNLSIEIVEKLNLCNK